jgi:hypothetical protein
MGAAAWRGCWRHHGGARAIVKHGKSWRRGGQRARARIDGGGGGWKKETEKRDRDERLKEAQIRFSRGDRMRCSPNRTPRVRSESNKLLARLDASG